MIRESIKQAMKSRNWSAVQLSDHTGIRHPTLTEFLSGKKGISFEYVEMIFKTLDLYVQAGGKNKNGDNPQGSATVDEPA
jgi:transcriptional regulator with XRE-family HTH domain